MNRTSQATVARPTSWTSRPVGIVPTQTSRAHLEADRTASTPVLRAGRAQALAALHLLAEPAVDLAQVAQVIETCPVMTLRVLHLANAPAVVGSEVDTVAQALAALGARAAAALVGDLVREARLAPMDHLWLVLARALACEALSDDPAGYTAGILSALADQLCVPSDVVVRTAGVSPAVADAVLTGAGPIGRALHAVAAHEAEDRGAVLRTGLAPVDVYDAYLRAFTDGMATAHAVSPA